MRAFVQRWQAGPLREVQIPPQTCIAAFLQMVQAPRMQEVRTLGEITVEDGGSWKLAAPASWGAYLHAPAQLKRDLAQARAGNLRFCSACLACRCHTAGCTLH